MLCPEYLTLQFNGSKGCTYKENTEKMFWDNVRLIITENGVTTVHNLAGGIERMEEHVNNYLNRYHQQGWQTIKVDKPEEKIQGCGETYWDVKKTILCMLKRSGNQNDNLIVRRSNACSPKTDIMPPSALRQNWLQN